MKAQIQEEWPLCWSMKSPEGERVHRARVHCSCRAIAMWNRSSAPIIWSPSAPVKSAIIDESAQARVSHGQAGACRAARRVQRGAGRAVALGQRRRRAAEPHESSRESGVCHLLPRDPALDRSVILEAQTAVESVRRGTNLRERPGDWPGSPAAPRSPRAPDRPRDLPARRRDNGSADGSESVYKRGSGTAVTARPGHVYSAS